MLFRHDHIRSGMCIIVVGICVSLYAISLICLSTIVRVKTLSVY